MAWPGRHSSQIQSQHEASPSDTWCVTEVAHMPAYLTKAQLNEEARRWATLHGVRTRSYLVVVAPNCSLSREYMKWLETTASTNTGLPLRILDAQEIEKNEAAQATEEFHRAMRELGRPNRFKICYDDQCTEHHLSPRQSDIQEPAAFDVYIKQEPLDFRKTAVRIGDYPFALTKASLDQYAQWRANEVGLAQVAYVMLLGPCCDAIEFYNRWLATLPEQDTLIHAMCLERSEFEQLISDKDPFEAFRRSMTLFGRPCHAVMLFTHQPDLRRAGPRSDVMQPDDQCLASSAIEPPPGLTLAKFHSAWQ